MAESDLDTLVRQVTDGFTLLCDEYRGLAQQHWRLEHQLSSANSQYATLRRLLPDEIAKDNTATIDLGTENYGLPPPKSLNDWLEEAGRKQISKPEDIQSIKEAEFASFKLQTRLKSGQNLRLTQLPTAASIRAARFARRPRQRFGGSDSQTPDIDEQDFTTPGNPGKLHCPFALINGQDQSKDQGCLLSTKPKDPPTPRSSLSRRDGSQHRESRRNSRRPSFVDPLRPDMKAASKTNTAPPSEAVSNGPGCPIRFLDQHSPEDLAKYFEDHKHELPRSHELCVKRFQDNADSIKELDAKYGNLVTMIQGLGAKHQPMLPEVPNTEANLPPSEDTKSAQKVKDWARDVSDSQRGEEDDPHKVNGVAEPENREAPEEERLPHFDRPLKEIRVGESPSRPWGVPIPSKYLNRSASELSSEAAAPPYAQNDTHKQHEVEPRRQRSPAKADHPDNTVSPQRQKGKCPFDHTAMMKSKQQQQQPPPIGVQTDKPIATTSPALASRKPEADNGVSRGIVNHGMAIVSSSDAMEKSLFTNHGTLLLGFDQAKMSELLKLLK